MTQIVLQIENELDLEPILAIIHRLNIKHYTTNSAEELEVLSINEFNKRKEGILEFAGMLNANKGYYPTKNEFYEQ